MSKEKMSPEMVISFITQSEEFIDANTIQKLCDENGIHGSEREKIFSECYDEVIGSGGVTTVVSYVKNNLLEIYPDFNRNNQKHLKEFNNIFRDALLREFDDDNILVAIHYKQRYWELKDYVLFRLDKV